MRYHRARGRTRSLLVLAAAPFLTVSLLVPAAPAPAADAAAAVASPEPLPTVQVNGVVWDQEVVGSTVYAVGSFDAARPAGSPEGEDEVPRANALAYDIATGQLLDWAPTADGAVNAVAASADGTTLYLGGSFTSLNGEATWRVGAVEAATAARRPLAASANATVRDLEVSPDGTTLYVGGDFTQVNSSARQRVAAVDLGTQTLTGFAPEVSDHGVRAVAVSVDGRSVAIGGSFTEVNGSSRPGEGMAVLETDGTLRPNQVSSVVSNSGDRSGIMSLEADAQGLYAVSYSRTGEFEGMLRADWDTGEITLMADCHGDSYDVYPAGDVVYVASHTHDCSNIGGFADLDNEYRHAVAYAASPSGTVQRNRVPGYVSYEGNPATTLLDGFLPQFQIGSYTGTYQATWTVEGNDDYVVYGGEFLAVNGTAQQGLVRFAARGDAGAGAEADAGAGDAGAGDVNGGDAAADDGGGGNDGADNDGGDGNDGEDNEQDAEGAEAGRGRGGRR
ncbi:WD40 repeat domain-containing protein [Actinomyces wuliandei]|uniref:WD40 repeat domain-containing protein n=1 Tax=Actinomyces wuliandei TaxID=2057743 RepID=UPI000FDA3B31|nr:hypothetical protein [Actinomyces wuliandei]